MEIPNLIYIKELSGGDKVFESKLINIIKTELKEEKTTYYNKLKNKKYSQTAQIVHKLKHKISILGLEKSYYKASDYESDLKNKNSSLSKDFEDILDVMTLFLSQI